jgi:hypothetical protein
MWESRFQRSNRVLHHQPSLRSGEGCPPKLARAKEGWRSLRALRLARLKIVAAKPRGKLRNEFCRGALEHGAPPKRASKLAPPSVDRVGVRHAVPSGGPRASDTRVSARAPGSGSPVPACAGCSSELRMRGRDMKNPSGAPRLGRGPSEDGRGNSGLSGISPESSARISQRQKAVWPFRCVCVDALHRVALGCSRTRSFARAGRIRCDYSNVKRWE